MTLMKVKIWIAMHSHRKRIKQPNIKQKLITELPSSQKVNFSSFLYGHDMHGYIDVGDRC